MNAKVVGTESPTPSIVTSIEIAWLSQVDANEAIAVAVGRGVTLTSSQDIANFMQATNRGTPPNASGYSLSSSYLIAGATYTPAARVTDSSYGVGNWVRGSAFTASPGATTTIAATTTTTTPTTTTTTPGVKYAEDFTAYTGWATIEGSPGSVSGGQLILPVGSIIGKAIATLSRPFTVAITYTCGNDTGWMVYLSDGVSVAFNNNCYYVDIEQDYLVLKINNNSVMVGNATSTNNSIGGTHTVTFTVPSQAGGTVTSTKDGVAKATLTDNTNWSGCSYIVIRCNTGSTPVSIDSITIS